MYAAQVITWAEGPRYVEVADAPAPSATQIRLKVLAAGLHQVVRSRASGNHYSAKELPHVVGVDCVGEDEDEGKGRLYYCLNIEEGFGTFAKYVTVDKELVHPLSGGVDPVSFAASVNPAFSSWMAITQRTANLPKDYSVLIMGATSASGRLAVKVARELGAGKIIGVARNGAALDEISGLDERIVLKAAVTETDFSGVGGCDLILDYVYGDAAVHLLSSLKTRKPVQYVHIGAVGGQATAALPSHVLRSGDLSIRGSGPGAWRLSALQRELKTLVPKMCDWKLVEGYSVPLSEIEKAWNDKELMGKGRLVFRP